MFTKAFVYRGGSVKSEVGRVAAEYAGQSSALTWRGTGSHRLHRPLLTPTLSSHTPTCNFKGWQ